MNRIKTGQAKLTDPAYVAAAQKVADLGSKGYFGKGVASLDYGPAEDLFLQGKAAMFYMGSWVLGDSTTRARTRSASRTSASSPSRVVGGTGPRC